MSNADALSSEFGLIAELVAQTARLTPARIAVIDGSRQIAYGAFDTLIDRVASALQRDGVAPQQTIAVCAESSIEYVATFIAGLRVGAVVCPLAPSASARSLADMAQDCGARILFLDAATHAAVQLVDAGVPRVALDNSAFGAPFADWLAREGAKPEPVNIEPQFVFNVIYSSGTTGTPKGIEQSHAMRWGHVRRAAHFEYGSASVSLIATPLYSNTTLVSVFPALAMGGALVLMRKFNAREFLELAQKHGVTHAMLVPVQYQRILAVDDFDRFDLSRFKVKFSTSAPLPADRKREILDRWPGGLVEYYGMTEGGGTCILQAHAFPRKLHTVGQPAEGHDVRLIDEAGRAVAPGATGEVVGRSGAMMNGYRNQPDKTAEAEWFDEKGDRFIRTGDIGRFDEDGFLILVDRAKDMIISGGFNVYPSDLEAALVCHPVVAEASVVGAPSPEWGETPVAFVALKPGAQVEAEDLRGFANAQLGKVQRISRVYVVQSLPRSSIGKVLKRQLRDELAKRPL